MEKIQLLFLLLALTVVSANAQKSKTKNSIDEKNITRQKADAWQEYKQSDFTVKFPRKPIETNNVYDLAEKSTRYAADESNGVRYSIDRLEFGKVFWRAFEGFDQKKTIFDNLENQQESLGATLLFKTEIFQQSVSGRTTYYKLKEKNGEVWDLLQNAFKKDDWVYVVRVFMPVKLLRNEANGLKDFPPPVKDFLASFRFLPDVKESNTFPPPPPVAPKPTKSPKNEI